MPVVKKVEIWNARTVDKVEFGLGMVLCVDGESAFLGGTEEERKAVIDAAYDALRPTLYFQTDDYLPHWNGGGKFSHQAKMYGFERVTFGVVKCCKRTVACDEYGEAVEGEWQDCPLTEMPADWREAIEKAEAAWSKAVLDFESGEGPKA